LKGARGMYIKVRRQKTEVRSKTARPEAYAEASASKARQKDNRPLNPKSFYYICISIVKIGI